MSGAEGGDRRPRLGFVGLGWIGRLRLDAVANAGSAEIAALCDPDPERLGDLGARFPGARAVGSLRELLDRPEVRRLDGLVLATPSALHAPHAVAALGRGLPLFVQKPLGIDRHDVERVLEAARTSDRLVEVDYSYRHLEAVRALTACLRHGGLGEVHLVEASFHNAYGPDKPWCFDPAVSGGGCLLDLGVHLLDLVYRLFGPGAAPRLVGGWVRDLSEAPGIDGFAGANLVLATGLHVRVTTSWHAHTGRDCDFRLTLHGTRGGAEVRNVDGSFYDFELVVRRGRSEQVLTRESRTWMNRGILSWVERLRAGASYDPTAETNLVVAATVDRVYDSRGADHPDSARPSAVASSRSYGKERTPAGRHT